MITRGTILRSLLAAALAASLAAPAGAAPSYRFNGGGNGHGIGLSQWGGYGLASKWGWGAAKILKHYYTGTKVTRRDPPKKQFRVGLLQGRSAIDITVTKGSALLRLKNGQKVESVGAGNSRKILVTSGKRYRVKRPGGAVVGGHDWGSAKNALRVIPRNGGVVKVQQWGHSIGRGKLIYPIVGRRRGHVVVLVKAEHYLYGLGEVPSSWPMAVLKAQAMAGRTYAYRVVQGDRTGCACDIRGDTRDQAYIGWDKEAGTSGGRWRNAVNRTQRKVVVRNGGLVTTYYSASSGGYTENIEKVWVSSSPQPHLKAVCDPGDWTGANPYRLWSVSFKAHRLANELGRPNGMSRVTSFQVKERGESGRVVKATIKGKKPNGQIVSWTTDGWDLRTRLGLRETRFWVNQDRDVVGAIRTKYDKLECAPGLAASRQHRIKGARWQNFQTGRMYHHLGRKKVAWLYGPVLQKYLDLKGHRGFLGRPYAHVGEAGGKRGRFDGGDVYWTEGLDPHALHGRVLKKYRKEGGPKSALKFPTSDVETLPDGDDRATFEGGEITCTPGGGCSVTYT